MEPANYSGVLFDFDGTITKPVSYWAPMKREMGIEDGVSILDCLAEAPAAERARLEEILFRYEAAAVETAEVNQGMWSVLRFLEEGSVPFGIVTNNAGTNVETVLDRFHIRCSAVISRDFGFWKPDPRPVLEGCRALGLVASEVIFIGDGRHDMQAGRASGTRTVGLINRPRKNDGFIELCDHVIYNLTELVPILERLLSADRVPRRKDPATGADLPQNSLHMDSSKLRF